MRYLALTFLLLSACGSLPDGTPPATLQALNGDYRVTAFAGAPALDLSRADSGTVRFRDGWLVARVGCNAVEGKMMLDGKGRLQSDPDINQGSLSITAKGCREASDPTRPSAAEQRDDAMLGLLAKPVPVFIVSDGRVTLARGRYRLELQPDQAP